MCGATIKAIAAKCRFCGEMISPVISGTLQTGEIRTGRLEPRGFLALFVIICPHLSSFRNLLWTVLVIWLRGDAKPAVCSSFFPFGVGAGIFFGLFFGIMMAFMIRRDSQSVPTTILPQ
jgi:hypothetical protein